GCRLTGPASPPPRGRAPGWFFLDAPFPPLCRPLLPLTALERQSGGHGLVRHLASYASKAQAPHLQGVRRSRPNGGRPSVTVLVTSGMRAPSDHPAPLHGEA